MKEKKKVLFHDILLDCNLIKYANGQNALRLLHNGLPYGTPSIAISDVEQKEDEIFIKNYNENRGVLEALIKAEIIKEPHNKLIINFVNIHVCKLLI